MIERIAHFVLKYLIRYRLDVINSNLKKCFVDVIQIKKIRNEYYRVLSQYLVQGLLPPKQAVLEKAIIFDNPDLLNSDKSSNVIILASHLGNWELITPFLSTKLTKTSYGVYQPIKNKWVDRYIKKQRSKYGLRLVPMQQILRNLYQAESKVISLISDQSPPIDYLAEEITFLGQKTRWYNSVARFKALGNCSFYYQSVHIEQGNYRITYLPIMSSNVLEEYVSKLEQNVLAHPEYWLWSHNRWKGMD